MARADLDALVDVAHAHAAAEEAGDIETTMATLDDDPLYELLPMGVGLRGRDAAREYYEHFFAHCMPRIQGFTLRSEWITDEGVGQEYQLIVDGPDGPARHDIIGILTFGTGEKLSGERIYASDELLRIMFGPLLDRAIPLSAD
jgi:hypothetical protein